MNNNKKCIKNNLKIFKKLWLKKITTIIKAFAFIKLSNY